MTYRLTPIALALAVGAGAVQAAPGEAPSKEEMWRMIQAQQRQIEALKARLEQTDAKVEATGEVVESRMAAPAAGGGDTHISGYGELHYNNLDGSGGAGDKDELDFHRFVLEFGHEFTDNLRFFSELEIEHALAGDGAPGEVELEQAYVEFDLNDRHAARGGLFLLPVGILNETHEPTTFYGVERNPIEKNIIPTTWWEGGAALRGRLGGGFSYDAALHSGLKTSAGDDYAIRAGRQKVAEADAEDLAVTGRLKWTGMPGVELAGSFQHQADITQSQDPSAGGANLFEAHAVIERGPFGLRALYALWDLDGSGPAAIGADEQEGFYIEPSFKLNDRVGFFARYNQWDNQAGSSASASEKTQWNVGLNWWPHPDVVLKADYQVQDNDDGRDQDGFNLGVGYQF